MGLRLGGTGTDGGPGNEILKVLRRYRVKRLGGERQAKRRDVEQHLARSANATVNAERVVDIRIVDQSLPTHRGARLFEIGAHHHEQRVLRASGQRGEPLGIVERGLLIVD